MNLRLPGCRLAPGALLLFLISVLPLTSPPLRAAEVSLDQLEKEIGARLDRVPEFRFIAEEAKKMGVRVWLFGGTAAGYAQYVKSDLLREAGDKSYHPSRFDYDYTSIYRSTQDLDVVVDGTPEQAHALQSALASAYPHFQGSKSDWEVRPLRASMNDKVALLDNPDFLNQHTDSHSTGMIEISHPPSGESAVRDLREWNQRQPTFLKDVRSGTLHYYFSDQHFTTSRFQAGKNPPIVSVIRYLTKAFQFNLKIPNEDMSRIRQVIAAFDPNHGSMSQYVRDWIERNGKKLFNNAQDVEYAWNTLEELGLRKKLVALSDPKSQYSLAWWLSKEPLRSRRLGESTGPTAASLGITEVAHETESFLAYESITTSPQGAPNVFISRDNSVGEVAAHGNGFYTRIGKEGARGTGLTVRFHVKPDAVEGRDFTRVGDYLVFTNRQALEVIPEALRVDVLGYMKLVHSGKLQIADSDRGILEKLRRRISNQSRALPAEVKAELIQMAEAELKRWLPNQTFLQEFARLPLVLERIDLLEKLAKKDLVPASQVGAILTELSKNPANQARADELVKRFFDNTYTRNAVLYQFLPSPAGVRYADLLFSYIPRPEDSMEREFQFLCSKVLSKPHWAEALEKNPDALIRLGAIAAHHQSSGLEPILSGYFNLRTEGPNEALVKALVDSKSSDLLGKFVGHQEWKQYWLSHPEEISAFLSKSVLMPGSVSAGLGPESWLKHPEWVDAAIKDVHGHAQLAEKVLALDGWKNTPQWVRWVETIRKKSGPDAQFLFYSVYDRPEALKHPEWVFEAIPKRDDSHYRYHHDRTFKNICQQLSLTPGWLEQLERDPGAFLRFADYGAHFHSDDSFEHVLQAYFNLRAEPDRNLLTEVLASKSDGGKLLLHRFAGNPAWRTYWEQNLGAVDGLIRQDRITPAEVAGALDDGIWFKHPDWVDAFIKSGSDLDFVSRRILSQPGWKGDPRWVEWVERFRKRISNPHVLLKSIYRLPEVMDHPEWIASLIPGSSRTYHEQETLNDIMEILMQPEWISHLEKDPTVLLACIRSRNPDAICPIEGFLSKYAVLHPEGPDPKFLAKLLEVDSSDLRSAIASEWFSHPKWAEFWLQHPEPMEQLVLKATEPNESYALNKALALAPWKDHPALRKWVPKGTLNSHGLAGAIRASRKGSAGRSLGACLKKFFLGR